MSTFVKSNCLALFCLFAASNVMLGQELFTSLVYDSSKTYEAEEVVIPSLSNPTIYTALQAVPMGTAPESATGERINTQYWGNGAEFTSSLEEENSAEITDVPDDEIVDTSSVQEISAPTEETDDEEVETSSLPESLQSLIYDPQSTYEEGAAVIPSLSGSRIYIALMGVPEDTAPEDDSGDRINTNYWANQSEWTDTITDENSEEISEVPNEDIVDAEEVENLTTPIEHLTTKLDWFGLRFEKGNWAFHSLYGWIYITEPENEEVTCFFIPDGAGDLPASWNWTTRDIFPLVYNSEIEWLEFSGPEFFALLDTTWEYEEDWGLGGDEDSLGDMEWDEVDPDSEPWDEPWYEEEQEEEGYWDDIWMDESWEDSDWGMIHYNCVNAHELAYNPDYSYHAGQAAMTRLQDEQIYTAKEDVPWSRNFEDFSPDGPNGDEYWQTFEQTVALLEEENPDFLEQLPEDVDIELLYTELEEWMGWEDEEDWEGEDGPVTIPWLFGDLLYDPLQKYPTGSAVLLNLEDGEIYTSKANVPAGKSAEDDTYSPIGPNAREYWTSSYETTLTFEINHADFMEAMPRHLDASLLSMEVAERVAFDMDDLATMDDVFGGLLYDPHKSYYRGDAVVLAIESGEIYTAKKKVPAAPEGENGPEGEFGEEYWYSSEATTAAFAMEHADFVAELPEDIDWDDLHVAISKLSVSEDLDSDNDGLSDYLELFEYNTNPDTDDSDEDGLPDHLEIELGSNPAESDEEMVTYLTGLGEEEAMYSIFNNLSAHGLVTQEEYQQIQEQLEFTSDANATPYTPDWFFIPERGWLWTSPSVYPYFFDSNSSGFLYFKSGGDEPQFYNFHDKKWFILE